MFSAVKQGALTGIELDAERFGERRAQLAQIRDPVADSIDVERLARDHFRLEPVLLGFFERTGKFQHLAEGKVGLDGGHDFLDDGRELRDDGR